MYVKPYLLSLIGLVIYFLVALSTVRAEITNSLNAQPKFTHLTVDDGLSNNTAYSVVQDAKGFIWIGTRGGLNRYDGTRIKTFLADPSNINSISNNWVWNLMLDRNGNLWVVTWGGGITRINLSSDTYTHFKHDKNDPRSLSSNNVGNMLQDATGVIWVGTEKGLDRLDADDNGFTHYRHDIVDVHSLSANSIQTLKEDLNGRLWIGTYGGGISVLDEKREKFTRYSHAKNDKSSLSNDNVWSVLVDRQGDIWVGTEAGLDLFDKNINGFEHHKNIPNDVNSLAADTVTTLYQDSTNRIWVGTWGGGVSLLDKTNRSFTTLALDLADTTSLSDNTIWKILEDRDGAFWVVTENGVDKFDTIEHRFSKYTYQVNNLTGLSAPTVDAFYQDEADQLWIGTLSGGLNKLNPSRNHYTQYLHDPADSNTLASNDLNDIEPDGKGGLWIATPIGLNHFDPINNKFKRVQGSSKLADTLINSKVRDLSMDMDGMLWAALYGIGIDRFDPRTGEITHYRATKGDTLGLSTEWMKVVEVTSQGTLWAGGDGGLNYIDMATGEIHVIENLDSVLPSINITSIHEDSAGYIWIGTTNGLSRYDVDSKSFKAFNDESGESGKEIMSILEDETGNFWIGTPNGLSRLNPATGVFRTYNTNDNLQNKMFRFNSAYANAKGELFFGGVAGFNSFFPSNIVNNESSTPVLFTDIKINDKTPTIGPQSPLKKSIAYTDMLILTHEQSSFSLEFSAVNYTNAANNQYSYMLEGFDEDWHQGGDSYRVNYTNLDPGDYAMRVKAANNDGVWGEASQDLNITILPAWWQSWWWYTLVAISTGLAIQQFVRWRLSTALLQRKALEEKVSERTGQLRLANADAESAKEKAQSANTAKSVFLANMSHELRTPLNVVLGFSELMVRDQHASEEQKTNLNAIERAGRHLLGLIDDVLDMSKIEAGHTELELLPNNLHAILDDIDLLFRQRAERKNLNFTLKKAANLPKYLEVDEGKLRQVLINLLGNAHKFTDTGGISLSVKADQSGENQWKLSFAVEDTGCGISEEGVKTVFDPFVQTGRSPARNQGTGLGLAISYQFIELMGGKLGVDSVLKQGSTFYFEITAFSSEAVVATDKQQLNVASIESSDTKWRILVVDDLADNRLLLNQLLTSVGFSVRDASNGEQAVQLFESWQPHLIWMDIRMPVMDGIEATSLIRKLPGGKSVKILALTASVFSQDLQPILDAGCNAILNKPYASSTIFEAMTEHLGITFVYEKLVDESPSKVVEINISQLFSQPAQWRQEFLKAVQIGNIKAMLALTEKLPECDSALRDILDQHINGFQLEVLNDLFATKEHSLLPVQEP